MPLQSGKSQKVISSNIKEVMHSFHKKGSIGTSHPKTEAKARAQAAAIAYEKARGKVGRGDWGPQELKSAGGSKTEVPKNEMVNPANDKLLKELYGPEKKCKNCGKSTCSCMQGVVAGA